MVYHGLQQGFSPTSHAVSIIATDQEEAAWAESQAAAKVLLLFDESSSSKILLEVEFVHLSLLRADIMTTVCRTILSKRVRNGMLEETENLASETEQQTAEIPPVNTDEWYEIEKLLRGKKKGMESRIIVVEWKSSGQMSWVKRQDVFPAALQPSCATKKTRRRHKRN